MIQKQTKKDFSAYINNAVMKSKVDPDKTFVFTGVKGDMKTFADDVVGHLGHFIEEGPDSIALVQVDNDLFGVTDGKLKPNFQKEVGKLGGLNVEEYVDINTNEEHTPGLEWSDKQIAEFLKDEAGKKKMDLDEDTLNRLIGEASAKQKESGLDMDDIKTMIADEESSTNEGHSEESEKDWEEIVKEYGFDDMKEKALIAFKDKSGNARIKDAETEADLWNALDFLGLLDEFVTFYHLENANFVKENTNEAKNAKALAKVTTKRRIMDFKKFRENRKNIENDSKEVKGKHELVQSSMSGDKTGKDGRATLEKKVNTMRISTFEKFVNEAKLFEVSDDGYGTTISVNGVELDAWIHVWGDQPDVGVSAGLEMSNPKAWEKLIKAGIWSEKFFTEYQADDSLKLQYFAVSRELRGEDNHVDNYDASDVTDMFSKKMAELDKEISPEKFVKMVKAQGDYTDIRIIDDSMKELKLAAYKEFVNSRALADTVKSISKADLVKMARGAKELSPVAEKAIKMWMKVNKKSRPESIEDILNLMTADNK